MERNQHQYNMPLKILSYDELYGWTMDRIVSMVEGRTTAPFVVSSAGRPLGTVLMNSASRAFFSHTPPNADV
jgi:hypothetical protein